MSIVVLCPTRERPGNMVETARSVLETRHFGSTRIVAVIDHDDPAADKYVARSSMLYDFYFPIHDGGMVAALNAAAKDALRLYPDMTILGFVGDDHRFRTEEWDRVITETLAEKPGFAYAYDGFWHKGEIPTQIFISREIVIGLGYFALPDCRHLYVDNAWRALGDATGALHYRSELLIEHMHPTIGKAEWDEGYKRVNSAETYAHDRAAFEAWRASPRFTEDVRRVRRALGTTIQTRR